MMFLPFKSYSGALLLSKVLVLTYKSDIRIYCPNRLSGRERGDPVREGKRVPDMQPAFVSTKGSQFRANELL